MHTFDKYRCGIEANPQVVTSKIIIELEITLYVTGMQ